MNYLWHIIEIVWLWEDCLIDFLLSFPSDNSLLACQRNQFNEVRFKQANKVQFGKEARFNLRNWLICDNSFLEIEEYMGLMKKSVSCWLLEKLFWGSWEAIVGDDESGFRWWMMLDDDDDMRWLNISVDDDAFFFIKGI